MSSQWWHQGAKMIFIFKNFFNKKIPIGSDWHLECKSQNDEKSYKYKLYIKKLVLGTSIPPWTVKIHKYRLKKIFFSNTRSIVRNSCHNQHLKTNKSQTYTSYISKFSSRRDLSIYKYTFILGDDFWNINISLNRSNTGCGTKYMHLKADQKFWKYKLYIKRFVLTRSLMWNTSWLNWRKILKKNFFRKNGPILSGQIWTFLRIKKNQ